MNEMKMFMLIRPVFAVIVYIIHGKQLFKKCPGL